MREREYLRVTPTSEELTPRGIPKTLESLHKLTPDSSGLWSKLNPFTSATPPCFEFLALSTGQDAPVEFYYGADDYLGTLEDDFGRSIRKRSTSSVSRWTSRRS